MGPQAWDVTLCYDGRGRGLDPPLSLGPDATPLLIDSSEYRKIKVDEKSILISGTKVRVGAGGCTKTGLSKEEIEEAERAFVCKAESSAQAWRETALSRSCLSHQEPSNYSDASHYPLTSLYCA